MATARGVVVCVAVTLWLLPATEARVYTGDEDLSVAWAGYLVDHRETRPRIEFPYQHCFTQAAANNELPETLLIALARGESDFNARARSRANAHGLMQILWPSTARHLGIYRLSQLYEPCRNVDAGARYLKELLDHYDDDLHLALAAYNYGPGRIPIGAPIPSGAEWYSGYIYRHMNYVLARSTPEGNPAQDYFGEGKLELIVFSEPYRAAAFVSTLEDRARGISFDWFRAGPARYRVVMLYADQRDLERNRRRLAAAGFSVKR